MYDDKIKMIYQKYIESQEYNQLLKENVLDISWIRKKLDNEEYIRLEDTILAYASQDDELLFKAGFQFAWDLCWQCKTNDFHPKDCKLDS